MAEVPPCDCSPGHCVYDDACKWRDWDTAELEGKFYRCRLLADETFAKDPKSELPIRTNSPQWKGPWDG